MAAPDPESFAQWLRDDQTSIGDALLHLSEVLTDKAGVLEHGRFALDEIADTVESPTTAGIVAALFDRDGFRGDVENYHDEDNSFLDRVLLRRKGMPITLSAIVIEVGQRVGVPLTMVGMPGHVIVGTENDGHYIDAFGGVEVDRRWVEQRFRSIFGAKAGDLPPLQNLTVIGAVNRVCNNLMRTWADDRSGNMDRLLDLRAIMPGSPADRGLLIDVAARRGRYDLAAQLRELNDPDDPEIQSLWARLN